MNSSQKVRGPSGAGEPYENDTQENDTQENDTEHLRST
jgi:hypothetical protein